MQAAATALQRQAPHIIGQANLHSQRERRNERLETIEKKKNAASESKVQSDILPYRISRTQSDRFATVSRSCRWHEDDRVDRTHRCSRGHRRRDHLGAGNSQCLPLSHTMFRAQSIPLCSCITLRTKPLQGSSEAACMPQSHAARRCAGRHGRRTITRYGGADAQHGVLSRRCKGDPQ